MARSELHETAEALVAPGKGFLAADESEGTIKKRFAPIGVESTEEHRRSYREMLFTTPGAEEYISGVILFDETIRQSASDGTPFPELLASKGIMPGIKVDKGAKPLALADRETITEGLDGLRARLEEYRGLGARFAKWRATYSITDELPSDYCVWANAHALARYAALCQEAGIVPIVEPEVLMDGDHTIERCEEVTTGVLTTVFQHLHAARISLEGMVLKPNMVVPGKKSAKQAQPAQVAEATLRTLKRCVPSAVPGIAFLSGGQSPTEATLHLNLMNAAGPLPWALTFSYGRALQENALSAWGGKAAGFSGGQKALFTRAKLNGLASVGAYNTSMESSAA
jgi:fructose-bisphosphate aldolase class I